MSQGRPAQWRGPFLQTETTFSRGANLKPIRQTVPLSQGTVVLEQWGVRAQEAYTLDILRVTNYLLAFHDDEQGEFLKFRKTDVEQPVWDSFWRLVDMACVEGTSLPGGLSFGDRMALLEAIASLNDLSEARKKLMALKATNLRMLEMMLGNLQSQTTTPPSLPQTTPLTSM